MYPMLKVNSNLAHCSSWVIDKCSNATQLYIKQQLLGYLLSYPVVTNTSLRQDAHSDNIFLFDLTCWQWHIVSYI